MILEWPVGAEVARGKLRCHTRATLLHSRAAIEDELFGGLLLYAEPNTLLSSLVLRAPFDVARSPLKGR